MCPFQECIYAYDIEIVTDAGEDQSGSILKCHPICKVQMIKSRKAMNRSIAILLLVLICAGLIFSTFALFQGQFALALSVYPLLILAYFMIRSSKKQ